MMTTLDDIVEIFELLGDWDQRYQYLTELGEKMPAMPEALKTEANKVKGCMSQVWVSAYCDKDDPHRVRFHGDCDTSIIKGVLAVLIQ
ncbi:MAG: SufE family protein, partial [Granulosicoccaceae bacterium]